MARTVQEHLPDMPTIYIFSNLASYSRKLQSGVSENVRPCSYDCPFDNELRNDLQRTDILMNYDTYHY
jgi:hypothetical protein